MASRPAWVRRHAKARSLEASRPANAEAQRFAWRELAVALAALGVSAAAFVFSIEAYRESERATAPVVAIAADAKIRVEVTEGDQVTAELTYWHLVLANRGRTPVDVLQVTAIDVDGQPIEADVFFGSTCSGNGHATLAPGASLTVVSLQVREELVPQRYEVLLATGIEALPVERRREGIPEVHAILRAYEEDARALLLRCVPERAVGVLD